MTRDFQRGFRSDDRVARSVAPPTAVRKAVVAAYLMTAVFFPVFMQKAGGADKNLSGLEERAFKEAIAAVSPSVVRIQTVGGVDRVGNLLTATGPTTGVVVSPDGYIISSAFNFISQPASILVQLSDGRRFPAVNVATDRSKMLTLLKIEESGLVPAPAAPKKGIRVGQWGIALGRTFDSSEPSVSVGIVSALGRVWGKAIQTDAKVSPVNYGGPLVNVSGEVLGVLVPLSPQENEETAGVEWYDSGIGFAIPMEDVSASFDRLKSGKDLLPGLMGITFKPGSLDAKPAIDRVRVESPAEKAGLKSGDVITEVDGRGVRRPDDVKFALGSKYAGDSLAVVVRRGDESVRTTLELVAELKPYESGFLGILPQREGESSDGTTGVGVRFVYADSPAAGAGIVARDRILRVNGVAVVNAAALADIVSRARPGTKITIVFRHDALEKTAEVTLASIPDAVLPELPSSPIPPMVPTAIPVDEEKPGTKRTEEKPSSPKAEDGKGKSGPDNKESEAAHQTGRFVVELPEKERSYWAYVPSDYNPRYRYGLMIWLQPEGDSMEATILQSWKSICDLRGIILIGPKPSDTSGWNPAETGIVKEMADHLTARYSVDPARVFVHTYGTGGPFAWTFAFKYRELVRGVCTASTPLAVPPQENHPDYRLQIYFTCGATEEAFRPIEASVKLLRQMKYPVSFSALPGQGQKYPADAPFEEIARWVDSLDRI